VVSAEADYVLWFLVGTKGTFSVATSLPGFPSLGDLGDAEQKNPLGSGGLFKIGYWAVEDNAWIPEGIRDHGAEATFFFVGRRNTDLMIDAPPDLFRPFFDLNNRVESGFLVAAPGIATGSINAHAATELWGAELNVWKNVFFDHPGTSCLIDLTAGFRYVNANTELDINSISSFNQMIPAASPFASFAGNRLQVMDSFATRNNFYGGQFGFAVKSLPGDNLLSLEGGLKVALGNTSEEVAIAGSQIRTFANGTRTVAGSGVLALASNSGTHIDNRFAQIPEADFKVSYPVGRHLRLTAGFSALYWTNIARPALQIDRSIDITQIPNNPLAAGATPTGLARPGVPFHQSDLWLLGINLGLEYRW
jgi:hypothetical protein